MRTVRNLLLAFVVGVGLGFAGAQVYGALSPTATDSLDQWPAAARQVIDEADARVRAQGYTISHIVMPIIRLSSGAVYTVVGRIEIPEGRTVYAPLSIEVDDRGEVVDVN